MLICDRTPGEITVDGSDLTAIIEWNGTKWNKIAQFDSGCNDEALQKDISNAKLFASASKMLSKLIELEDYFRNQDDLMSLNEANSIKELIDKTTK